MPLQLEIVTPERLAYEDEVDMVLVPGIDGELGILPHHTPLVSLLGVGELEIRKGGSEEIFAIAGGFLQVRPDKVVVMAETADLGSEIDLEKAQEARREAERRSRAATSRARTSRPPAAQLQRALLRIRVAERRHREGPRAPGVIAPWLTPGRSTGSTPRRRRRRRRSGSRAAGRSTAPCTCPGRRTPPSSCSPPRCLTGERCRFENVPEIEDVRVMTEVLRDLGVVVDHPAHGVYEIAAGDVDWLFIPLEAAAKMRASFILLGPLLARFGRVIISNPGGDRIGRRPVNLHVDAMRALGADIDYRNGYYYAKAPGRLAGRRGHASPGDRHGHRERDARGDPRRRPHGHPARGPGARGRRPHRRSCARWARRSRAPPRHDRGPRQAPPARRERTSVMPDRIETGHVPRRGRGHRRAAHARERGVRPRDGAGRRVRAGRRAGRLRRATIEIDATGLRPGDLRARATSRPRRTPASRPTSSRRPACS